MFEGLVLLVLLAAVIFAWMSGMTEEDYYSQSDYLIEKKIADIHALENLHRHICASSVVADRDRAVLEQAVRELEEAGKARVVEIYPERGFWLPWAYAKGENFQLCVPRYLLDGEQAGVIEYAKKLGLIQRSWG